MSESVLIVLITAIAVLLAVLVVVYFLKSRLQGFQVSVGKDGVDATVKSGGPEVQEISKNTLDGSGNKIVVERHDAHIRDNNLKGDHGSIEVRNPRS